MPHRHCERSEVSIRLRQKLRRDEALSRRGETKADGLLPPAFAGASAKRARNDGIIAQLFAQILSLPILLYRICVSPFLPQACRYDPPCSAYALEALARHGPLSGLWLALKRLARCHPWGGCGHDPVPPL